jgi:hypothetical protein
MISPNSRSADASFAMRSRPRLSRAVSRCCYAEKPIAPSKHQKRAFQQSSAVCAFCPEHEIASLQVHHIDGDPTNIHLDKIFVV